ncbi:uncharacterized protein TNCV_584491 [Trichonephila clavipes]|nr:uncharacterized protein TNCV_584491 [Trichonephila clavipes]
MLNDDEIVTSVQAEFDPVGDETDEDEDRNSESSKGPSNACTFSALETAMEWYEQQSECCPTQLLLLKRIKDLAAKNRRAPPPSVLTLPVLVPKGFSLNCLIIFPFFVFVVWRTFPPPPMDSMYPGQATGNRTKRIMSWFGPSCSVLTLRQ